MLKVGLMPKEGRKQKRLRPGRSMSSTGRKADVSRSSMLERVCNKMQRGRRKGRRA